MPYHIAWTYSGRPTANIAILLSMDDIITVEAGRNSYVVVMAVGQVGPPRVPGPYPIDRFVYLIEGDSKMAVHSDNLFEEIRGATVNRALEGSSGVRPAPPESLARLVGSPHERIVVWHDDGQGSSLHNPGTLVRILEHPSPRGFSRIITPEGRVGRCMPVRISPIQQESPVRQDSSGATPTKTLPTRYDRLIDESV